MKTIISNHIINIELAEHFALGQPLRDFIEKGLKNGIKKADFKYHGEVKATWEDLGQTEYINYYQKLIEDGNRYEAFK